ncbi:MAG: hypothetical protein MUF42_01430 [Cytophagaceae bacterium]|jgi:predicted extracellular nuclease|nr:hypothetical protein [Cytophagaceae bacterium]
MRELEYYFRFLFLFSRIPFYVCILISTWALGQHFSIASYNVENLMDTLDNPHTNDNDFLPTSKNQWNTQRYFTKVQHLAEAISMIDQGKAPHVLGLMEVENRKVLEDLVQNKTLQSYQYQIVHADSKDERGIDVAFLYQKNFFKLLAWKTINASLEKLPTHTRDILLVKGIVYSDTMMFVVNHWPSRRGGKDQTEHKRITMALLVREVLDSLQQRGENIPVTILGDFNDEPTDKSLREVLLSKGNWDDSCNECVYNPFESLHLAGKGSYKYEQDWNMLDQILLSNGWRNRRWKLQEASIFHPAKLHYQRDLHQGPFKTFHKGKYKGGYSDHFPVYIRVNYLGIRKKNE